jgi:hypothetical protein
VEDSILHFQGRLVVKRQYLLSRSVQDGLERVLTRHHPRRPKGIYYPTITIMTPECHRPRSISPSF